MEAELVAYTHSGIDLARAWLATASIFATSITVIVLLVRTSANERRMIRQLERLRSSMFRLELSVSRYNFSPRRQRPLPKVVPFAEVEAEDAENSA